MILRFFHFACLFLLLGSLSFAQDAAKKPTDAKAAAPIAQGQKVYSIGHSFHVFMPAILNDIAKAAEIKDHKQVGLSSIGGSRVIQHWDVADDKFKSKAILKAGGADVLTMAPIYLPDDGIENFVALAYEGNPNIRITIQEFWLPFDAYTPPALKNPGPVDHDAQKISELREKHHQYFAAMDEHVQLLRKKHGKETIFVAPVGQAVMALREKIVDGKVPTLTKQSDLFTDPIGHAKPPLQALVAYVHYSVTYRQSPVGLPAPAVLGGGKNEQYPPELIKLLQEIAWQAAIDHPLSGVKEK
jgi:hypothetical protein